MSKEKIRVLYVDDEVNNLQSFKAALRKKYEIFTATSAKEGFDILGREEIHIVISDQRMAGITGIEFLESVMEKYPDPIRMLLTGYADLEEVIKAVNNTHIFKYITKPWKQAVIIKAIEEGYAAYSKKTKHKEMLSTLMRTNEQLEFMLREKLIS